jgi:CubicO group peptidase (beta-lactamase class C family)
LKKLLICVVLLHQVIACTSSRSEIFPKVDPQEVGLSPELLNRIDKLVSRQINEGKIPGAVTLIIRNSKLAHFHAAGKMDENKLMREDTIFRIASMTKPITSTAVMILHEEGKISLDEPVSKYIPEFKNVQVGVREGKTLILVPARTPITIRHLLTHTSGITYRFEEIEPWASLYKDAAISDGLSETKGTIADQIKKLAKLPLMHQPGGKFSYGLSTDVLGYLIEVVSKMSLDEFLRQSIFEPLKMKDTYFQIPQEKLERLASVYNQAPDKTIKKQSEDSVEVGNLVYSAWIPDKTTYYSGGVGLVSTAKDYARFLQMLLNGGELDGTRILSRNSVDLMTTSHIEKLPIVMGLSGFGFGFGLNKDQTYGWSGFFHTTFFVDPQKKMIGIFMSQKYPADNRLHDRFRALALQSVKN